jgi:hypothetical protein
MHYIYLFLLSSALSVGFSSMGADLGLKIVDIPLKIEVANSLIPIQVYRELANKKKALLSINRLKRNDNVCLRGIYLDLKNMLERQGHEVTEERFVISRCNIPDSNISMDPNHTITIAQLAGYEPYHLQFIFKDPRRDQ